MNFDIFMRWILFNKRTRYTGREINRKSKGNADHRQRKERECETAEIRKMTTSTNNKDANAMESKKISWITPDEIDDKQITFPPPLTVVAGVETGSK